MHGVTEGLEDDGSVFDCCHQLWRIHYYHYCYSNACPATIHLAALAL